MAGQGPLCPYVPLPTHAPRVPLNPAPIAAKRRRQRCPPVSRETFSLSADVPKPHPQRMRCCGLRAHTMSPAHQLLRSRHTRPICVSYSATRLSASRRRLASGHRGHASDPTAGWRPSDANVDGTRGGATAPTRHASNSHPRSAAMSNSVACRCPDVQRWRVACSG